MNQNFEGVPFDCYRPPEPESEEKTVIALFGDLHAYGRDHNKPKYAAQVVNKLLKYYGGTKLASLGDFGSEKALENFQEILDDDVVHDCLVGDEDTKNKGFYDDRKEFDNENLHVHPSGLQENILGWDVAYQHDPSSGEFFDVGICDNRKRLLKQSIEVNAPVDETGKLDLDSIITEVRVPDHNVNVYGHSHQDFSRAGAFAVYDSPGSFGDRHNQNPDLDLADRTLQILKFFPSTLDVMTIDADNLRVEEHLRYEKMDTNPPRINPNRIVGDIGIERVHPNIRDRSRVESDPRGSEITLEEARDEVVGEFIDEYEGKLGRWRRA